LNRKILLPLFALALASMACNLQATPAPTQTPTAAVPATDTALPPALTDTPLPPAIASDTPLPPTPTLTSAPVTPAAAGLTLDQLKNGTYKTPVYGHTVTLVNGSYSEGSGANAFSVQMLGVYGFGDLNGDGKADAAIILSENGGGTGQFESVIAVTDQSGLPHQQSLAQLGDRLQIKSVEISSGVIHLDLLVQGPSDPMCCPSLAQKQNYWLIDNRLWLMRVTSTIGGTAHLINVDSPAIWTTVSNPFTVSGSLSVLPFENTLAYKIYTTDGTKVNESSLSVTPTTGTAGTFAHTFNLSAAGISNWVIIQFIDTSAADGSTISLGSVILKAH
jgi:Immunoglobulin-like domain of bacterial spore germination